MYYETMAVSRPSGKKSDTRRFASRTAAIHLSGWASVTSIFKSAWGRVRHRIVSHNFRHIWTDHSYTNTCGSAHLRWRQRSTSVCDCQQRDGDKHYGHRRGLWLHQCAAGDIAPPFILHSVLRMVTWSLEIPCSILNIHRRMNHEYTEGRFLVLGAKNVTIQVRGRH